FLHEVAPARRSVHQAHQIRPQTYGFKRYELQTFICEDVGGKGFPPWKFFRHGTNPLQQHPVANRFGPTRASQSLSVSRNTLTNSAASLGTMAFPYPLSLPTRLPLASRII